MISEGRAGPVELSSIPRGQACPTKYSLHPRSGVWRSEGEGRSLLLLLMFISRINQRSVAVVGFEGMNSLAMEEHLFSKSMSL